MRAVATKQTLPRSQSAYRVPSEVVVDFPVGLNRTEQRVVYIAHAGLILGHSFTSSSINISSYCYLLLIFMHTFKSSFINTCACSFFKL